MRFFLLSMFRSALARDCVTSEIDALQAKTNRGQVRSYRFKTFSQLASAE